MIIWLASYPKSGNTWLRIFIISLLSKDKDYIDLTSLNKIEQYPRNNHYAKLGINNIDFKNLNNVSKYWIDSQKKINLDKKIRFFKTHNAFCKINNNIFTNNENTLGTIYIVRDPRNVITSLKNHYHHESFEESKKFIFDENKGIFNKSKIKNNENFALPQVVGSWKTHYNSWKFMKKNYLLIKYENLINDAQSEFKKVASYLEIFLRVKFTNEQVNRAIKLSSFDRLQSLEEKEGFSESVINLKTKNKDKFFYLGPKNDWRKTLDIKISESIALEFKKEMKELGYL